MNEHGRIDAIRAVLHRSLPHVDVGIGDDAAVLATSSQRCVLSVDTSVEGVHFERAFASLREIGRRAVIAAASDLAAMGSKPRAALLSLIVPGTTNDDDLLAIAYGAKDASDELAMPIVGGNLARGTEISITTTVVGEAGPVIARTGARPGDGIYVTGHLGGAALGLAALQRSRGEAHGFFVDRWRRPRARVLEGMRLVGIATAGIDLSDGLAADLAHVLHASRVGARIFAGSLPLAPGFEAGCTSLGFDPIDLAISGGEDYELLFTAPAASAPDELATRIGEIQAAPGLRLVDRDGIERAVAPAGFDHFAKGG